ncbi:MAG: HIT domain-containing protein [Bacilli bacterium]|nr:HIT domain-containing protein [Bacilli bacterium]
MDCIFCKIINGEIPSYTLYEDDIVKVFLDITPNTNGHCLIVPKKHFVNLKDIDLETLNHIYKVAKDMYQLLKAKLNCEGLTLIQNNDYGQEVKHYHLHLMPRYENDLLNHNYNNEILKEIEETFKTIKGE